MSTADLDAEVAEPGADALDRLEGRQEVRVAGRTSAPSPMRVGMECSTALAPCPACRRADGHRGRPSAISPVRAYTQGNRLSSGDASAKLAASPGQRWVKRRGGPPRRLKGRGPAGGRDLVQGLWGKPSCGGLSLVSERSR